MVALVLAVSVLAVSVLVALVLAISVMVARSWRSQSWRSQSWPAAALPFDRARATDFLLQQQYAVKQRLRSRRAAGDVDVDRHDAIAAAHDRVGIMIIAPAIGAGTH